MSIKTTSHVRFEFRSLSGSLVSYFDTKELADSWLSQQRQKTPGFGSSMKLVKVTTYIQMEVVSS